MMAASDPPKPPHESHAGAARLTGVEISAINRFPDANPNPVLRYDDDGHLIYANPASAGVLKALVRRVGERLSEDARAEFSTAALGSGFVELVTDSRTWAVWPVPIPELGFTNLYGMDVTAERAIVKFPDQNPNPVLRIDWEGRLAYGNPASQAMLRGLGLEVGDQLPDAICARVLDAARRGDKPTIEVDSAGATYALLAVDLPEFGYINIYGTDITAIRERESLAAENERLLLNILPEPIANRLRRGEKLIADRHDDVTLLFADIVEFTRLSSRLSPAELVGVLNEVFTVFDDLVEQYGLEKVKTIGDAYMIVGGMSVQSADHTSRMASMALDLAAAIGRIDAAVRLGIRFRIGMHCGPVIAGVIGTSKFIYDVWGDTVNMASRMESLGTPGRIQVTHAVRERLGDAFEFESRGLIEVKGKGPTATYFLVANRAPSKVVARREALSTHPTA